MDSPLVISVGHNLLVCNQITVLMVIIASSSNVL